jgi:DNA (cytosine-5)-methyltransferase 1
MIAYPLLGKANPSHDESQDTLIAQCHGSNVGPMGELRRGNGGVTWGVPFVAHALTAQHTASGRMDPNGETFVTHALRADGFDASEDGTGRGTPLVVPFDTTQITSKGNYSNHKAGDPMHPLAKGQHAPAIAASIHPSHEGKQSYAGDGGTINVIARRSSVRRLTPRECERLQGFPDDYTLVTYRRKPAADGPRYRALGNSMAVPVMEWIGRRILDADRAVSHA